MFPSMTKGENVKNLSCRVTLSLMSTYLVLSLMSLCVVDGLKNEYSDVFVWFGSDIE